MKVLKFGGSSLADSKQFIKVKDIVTEDMDRKYIVVSAPGKGINNKHKITDLLLMCYELASHGLNFKEIFELIENTFLQIVKDLNLDLDLKSILNEIFIDIQNGASRDFTASRGEYLNAILLSNYLGWNFMDASEIIFLETEK